MRVKTKVWNFLRAPDGSPIEGAKIDVYVYPSTGGGKVHAYIYPEGDEAPPPTTESYSLTTDSGGYFSFFIADKEESEVYGYEFTDVFNISWKKTGITPGV